MSIEDDSYERRHGDPYAPRSRKEYRELMARLAREGKIETKPKERKS